MARSSDLWNLLLIAGVGYLAYQWYQSGGAAALMPGAGASIMCKFPDGTTIAMPAGNNCPYDASHGGQSTPCYPAGFVGPIPTGGAHC